MLKFDFLNQWILGILALFLGCCLSFHQASAQQCQITVNSTNGYTVQIELIAAKINPATTNCPFGYNYTVSIDYNIQISGPNSPTGLWTLQGVVGCATSTTQHFFNLPNNGGSGTVLSANGYYNGTDCNTATPTSMACNAVTVQIHGPGIDNQFLTCDFSPLPVRLLRFQAFAQNTELVRLQWTTQSEKDNSYFTVEHSLDLRDWQEVLVKQGAGTTNEIQQYDAQTAIFEPSTVNYYRLKQTDTDGSTAYSLAVAVHMHSSGKIRVYPNPVESDFTIVLGNANRQAAQAQLLSMEGQILRVWELREARQVCNIAKLSSGSYLLKIRTDNGWEHFKLLKI